MKKSNKKRRVRFLTLWAALIVIAASVFTACPQKPKPKPTPKFKVNFSVEGANGTLTAKLDGKTITGGTEAEKDKTVVFTATPASGYKVKSWTLDGNAVNGTNSTYSLKVTKAVTVKVSFESTTPTPPPDPANKYKVTFAVEGSPPNGTLKAQADGIAETETSPISVEEGKTVVFTATPAAQFAVEQWTVNGTPVPDNTANTYSHTVTAQADIGVSFKYAGPGPCA